MKVDKMKEFGYCPYREARVFESCPLFPQICRLTICMQQLCQEFQKLPPGCTQHADLARCLETANLPWFTERHSAFSSWCFSPSQAAPWVRVLLLLGRHQKQHMGKGERTQSFNSCRHHIRPFLQLVTNTSINAPD